GRRVARVPGEPATGVWQPGEEVGALARAYDALVVLDAVSSLGGAPVLVDAWQVDAAYSGSQKCLSAPPGLAPVTMSERARAAIGRRRPKVRRWYLDLTMM